MIDFCSFIEKIKQDPLQKISGLTVGNYYDLQDHIFECEKCGAIVDEIYEKYKNEPEDPDSAWNKTKYN